MSAAIPLKTQSEANGATGFGRWLHRSYFRGTALRWYFTRRIRPAGLMLGGAFTVAICLAAGHERAPVYQLFSLAGALAAISMPWALLRRARLDAIREVPHHATAGEPLRYAVRLKNHGRRLSRAWLLETPPDPRPDRDDFLTLREPGEEERNRFDRTFAYFRWQWLLLRNRLFDGGASADEIILEPGASTRIHVDLIPRRRGMIRLDGMRVALPDPFGFFQGIRRVPAPSAAVIVLPRRHPLPRIQLPGANAFTINGEATTNAIGQSGEFVGLRDYRPGDPPRHIHWKSWARTGRPIVKELEENHYPRYGLVFDTFSIAPDDHAFEESVSVAASFAAGFATGESLLDLMFVNNEAFRVTAGRGVERAGKLLEVLAGVSAQRRTNHHQLLSLVLRHAADMTSCIVILNGWDAARAEFLSALSGAGIACVPVIIGDGARQPGTPGYWIDARHTARDLANLPAMLVPHFI